MGAGAASARARRAVGEAEARAAPRAEAASGSKGMKGGLGHLPASLLAGRAAPGYTRSREQQLWEVFSGEHHPDEYDKMVASLSESFCSRFMFQEGHLIGQSWAMCPTLCQKRIKHLDCVPHQDCRPKSKLWGSCHMQME